MLRVRWGTATSPSGWNGPNPNVKSDGGVRREACEGLIQPPHEQPQAAEARVSLATDHPRDGLGSPEGWLCMSNIDRSLVLVACDFFALKKSQGTLIGDGSR